MKADFFPKVAAAAAAAGLIAATALAGGPVALRRSPALAPGLAAFPRLVAKPGDRAAERVNQALAAADARVRRAARECRAQGGRNRSEWSRRIAATMRGPRYLSLIADDEWFCGGAHPDAGRFALVYDLTTGAAVNWKQLLPAALAAKTASGTAGDGTPLGLISSPALVALYVKAAKAWTGGDCAGVLADSSANEGLRFVLWPDARADGIALQPADLPHAVAACGPEITIAMPELRKFGVEARLLDAIYQAHRQGWYDKAAR